MDLSALERNITNLETSLDSLEHWLAFMTALVVLGLVLEYWHELPEAIDALKKAWSWKPLCIISGAILITVGVAGELFVQSLASRKETGLRKANDAVFAGLNAEAAKARKDASNASERASQADERASENEKEAARLQKMAEAERLERIRLEAIVAPRSLSLDQQRLIAAACRRFSGHRVLLSSYGLDGEGAALGAQIISVLRSAGVTVLDGRATSIVTGGFELGVHVRGPDIERDFVSGLGNALSSIGKLQVSINDPPARVGGAGIGGGGQAYPAGTVFVSVMVGIKPVPILAAK
jgi:hypothetical protein